MASDKRTQKKEQIIYTAIKMLEQSSYSDVRIEDIAQKLDVVKSNIFYYFPSKAVLYLEVLEKLHSELIERFILEVNQTSIKNTLDFKRVIMKLTDIYIRDYLPLIKPSVEEIAELRKICQQWLPQMLHCNRCRADAVGALVNPCCFTR